MRVAYREAALLGHSPNPYFHQHAKLRLFPVKHIQFLWIYSCLQQSNHFFDCIPKSVYFIYLPLYSFDPFIIWPLFFLYVLPITLLSFGKIKTILILKSHCIDWTATITSIFAYLAYIGYVFIYIHVCFVILFYVIYFDVLYVSLFTYLCFLFLLRVTVVLCTVSFFCHRDKFLVCVNILGNKSHSDSDIKFRCNFEFVLQMIA